MDGAGTYPRKLVVAVGDGQYHRNFRFADKESRIKEGNKMGILDILKPKDKGDAGPKPDQAPKPLTITFSKGPTTLGGPRRVGSYGLAPLGKQKIPQLDANDVDYLILTSIQDNGPSTIGVIADDIHVSAAKVEHHITGKYGLLKGGCVKVVGMGGE